MIKLHIEPAQINLVEKACIRLDSLTKPQGSLGKLEELAQKLVLLTGHLIANRTRGIPSTNTEFYTLYP